MERTIKIIKIAFKSKREVTDDHIKRGLEILSINYMKFIIYRKKDNLPVSVSAVRSYPNIRLLYFDGGGTLPEFRNKGLYQASIKERAKFASKNNLSHITSLARVDSSGPILKKLGFQKWGTFHHWISFE